MSPARLPVILCAFAMAGWAAGSATLGGPVTGYIFNAQAGALQPMRGIPGAAYIGPAIVTGVEAAAVAPDGSAALAVVGGRLLVYTALDGAQPSGVAVQGAIANVDRFAWAADGSTAAIYSSRSQQAQILTSLAQSPSAAAPIDLTGVAGAVTAMVFDGQRIVVGVASSTSGGIYMAGPGASMQRIAPATSPSAIVLAGTDLYFADNQSQQIWQVRSYAATPAAVLFADDSVVSSPAGLQLSATGQRLYVANAGSRKLAVYDIASRSLIQSLDLDFAPSRLERFGSASVFLLNATGQGPLYVLSEDAAQKPTVYFVPPAKSTTGHKIHLRPI
jgi:hypothetical protein